MIKYRIAVCIMMLSYLYLSISGGSIKMKIIGFLLTIVNGMIFWR